MFNIKKSFTLLTYILSFTIFSSFIIPSTSAHKNTAIFSDENLEAILALTDLSEIDREKHIRAEIEKLKTQAEILLPIEQEMRSTEQELENYMRSYENKIKQCNFSENNILYLSFVCKSLYEGTIYYMHDIHDLKISKRFKKFIYYNFCKEKLSEIINEYLETHPDFSVDYNSLHFYAKLCATSFWFIFSASHLWFKLFNVNNRLLGDNNFHEIIFTKYIQKFVDLTCGEKTFEIKSVYPLRSRTRG